MSCSPSPVSARFPEFAPDLPDSLSKGLPGALQVGVGPEQVGEMHPAGRLAGGHGQVDEDREGFPRAEYQNLLVPLPHLYQAWGRAEGLETKRRVLRFVSHRMKWKSTRRGQFREGQLALRQAIATHPRGNDGGMTGTW